ncbi:MAG: histidine phosphatase family protein [Acidimicrobiales bacterium]
MLILLRHGQTEANASGQYLGRSDPPLTELGRAQARALAPVVAGAARVVSSPLVRATQTAESLNLGIPLDIDDRWVEMDYGLLDRAPLGTIDEEVARRWRRDPDYAPGGGESLAQVSHRVRRACEELTEEAARHHVVVVSHVSPIKAAVAWALGVGDEVAWRMFLALASVTRIATNGDGPSLHGFNDQAHLTK